MLLRREIQLTIRLRRLRLGLRTTETKFHCNCTLLLYTGLFTDITLPLSIPAIASIGKIFGKLALQLYSASTLNCSKRSELL